MLGETVSVNFYFLKTEQIRMFLQHACRYICAYHKLWKQQQQNDANSESVHNNDGINGMLLINVEKLVKKFKMHRCALDFDHAFCKAICIDLTKNKMNNNEHQ